jgi:AraC-like DNA-binding protein
VRADDAVAAARAQLDRLPVGIVCASPQGRIVFANRPIEDMVGRVPPGVPAEQWADRFGLSRTDGTAYADEREIPLIRALHQGDVRGTMRSRNGRDSVVLDSTATAVLGAGGRCLGSVGLFRPVSAQRSQRPSAAAGPGPSARAGMPTSTAEPVLLLAALHLTATADGPRPDSLGRRARDLIEERYAEPWTLDALARELSVSPAYLTGEVSRVTGRGAMHLLAESRVARAKVLLTTTSWPVSQVARAVGLADAERFARTFRRHAGLSPASYRTTAAQEPPERP